MLGRPEWFKRRKYGGWGLWPCCWQGWVYLAAILLPLVIIQLVPVGSDQLRLLAMFVWAAVILADSVHIMSKLPMDEREKLHEAVAERNAMWAMVCVLCAGVAFQAAAGMVRGGPIIDPVIFVALFAALVAKAATNIYLDRRD